MNERASDQEIPVKQQQQQQARAAYVLPLTQLNTFAVNKRLTPQSYKNPKPKSLVGLSLALPLPLLVGCCYCAASVSAAAVAAVALLLTFLLLLLLLPFGGGLLPSECVELFCRRVAAAQQHADAAASCACSFVAHANADMTQAKANGESCI